MTVTQVEPVVRQTPGGWLATTPGNEFPRIGVMAETSEEAKTKLAQATDAWRTLMNDE